LKIKIKSDRDGPQKLRMVKKKWFLSEMKENTVVDEKKEEFKEEKEEAILEKKI